MLIYYANLLLRRAPKAYASVKSDKYSSECFLTYTVWRVGWNAVNQNVYSFYTVSSKARDELVFELIPSRRGNYLLVAEGYSYTQVRPDYWRCSRKNKNLKCPATIRLKNGVIVKSNTDHSHPPRKQKSDEALEIKYEIGLSQRGRRLLLIDDYAFSQIKKGFWICSSKFPECKARLQLNDEGEVIRICREHSHPPRKYTRTSDGELIRLYK
nr:uncharacterized protein LOC117985857 [Maniola hyperantus]